ncbi:MAG: hypothetical protein ACRDPF_12100 [Streptosporangiaceae bacterium]
MTGGVTETLADPDAAVWHQDAAVWHQEADLPDPGAPSRRIESAAAISRFLDILGAGCPARVRAPASVAASPLSGDVNAG